MSEEAKNNFLARFGSAKHLDAALENSQTDMYSAMSNPLFDHTHIQKLIDSGHAGVRDIINHRDLFEKATPEQINHFAKTKNTATNLSYKIHELESRHIDSMLDVFEKHYNTQLGKNLGGMQKATPEQFDRMVKMDDIHMNQRLSANRNLPKEHIPKFMNSSTVINRMNIAAHPDLSHDQMETLSNDENQFVRTKIAGRSDLPEHLVHKMANDESPSVTSEIWVKHRVRK